MIYQPIKEDEKQEWIDWLKGQVEILSGKPEDSVHRIFSTPEGDVATGKDLVGNLLATLSGESVEIK